MQGLYAPAIIDAMKLLHELIAHLGLTKPVTVTIKTRRGKDCDALYLPHYSDRTAKLIGHKITIYTVDTSRDFDTLLAHELIHAKQEEMWITEIHGPVFAHWATDLEKRFGLREVYLDDIDKN